MKMIRSTSVTLKIILPDDATWKMIKEARRALRDKMKQDQPVTSNRRYRWSKIEVYQNSSNLIVQAERQRLYVETNV
jgi:hypothetical protein